MRSVAIVIGHGPKIDKGAENKDGTTELAWNTDLAARIASSLSGRCKTSIVHRATERVQPVGETNDTWADCAIELHLNSATGSATGTEMIFLQSSKEARILAGLLQEAAVGVLGLRNRGIKGPFSGRGERWLKGTTMPAVIVESFFIDNDADLARGNARKQELAEAYATALHGFVSK